MLQSFVIRHLLILDVNHAQETILTALLSNLSQTEVPTSNPACLFYREHLKNLTVLFSNKFILFQILFPLKR